MSSRTRDGIISAGLAKAGNDVKTIRDECIPALADFLDQLQQNHKWAHLEKTSTANTLNKSDATLSLPTDFGDLWNEHGLKIKDTNGKMSVLTIKDHDFLDMLADPTTEGAPDYAIFDLNAKKWTPYPRPDVSTSTWEIRYQSKPTRMGVTSTDVTPAFPDDMILVQFCFWFGLDYDDDDRAGPQLGLLSAMIRKAKARTRRSVIRRETTAFNPKFFQRMVAFR